MQQMVQGNCQVRKHHDMNVRKWSFLLVCMCCITSVSFAQTAAKSLYFELGGAGLATVNYDMRFQKKNDGFGFKVGFGGFKIAESNALLVPVGINYLIGKDNRNYFEVGLGLTIVTVNERYYNNGETTRDRFSSTFGHAFFGYRLQPKDGGFLFRAGLTPVFDGYSFIPYWAGVSFGYKF